MRKETAITPGTLTIVLLGPPVAKGRPRFRKTGVAYTPANTRAAETNLRYQASCEMDGLEVFQTPVSLIIHAEFQIPASWSKRKKNLALLGTLRHGSRPDIDNVVKAVKDGLNGVVWRDDSLVCELWAFKCYSNQPKLVIKVRSADGAPHMTAADSPGAAHPEIRAPRVI